MRVAVLAVAVAGCHGSSEPSCERYLAHVDELTHTTRTGPYNDAELAYCHKHTDEQLRCAIAATTVDDFGLCEQFTEPPQRTLARALTASIKPAWPGSADLQAVLLATKGCAFAGVMGQQFLVSEKQAVVAFAMRDVPTGDPTNIFATLVRDGVEWRCIETDPAGRCEQLAKSCKH
jgi:hypothetical protein